jgi:Domain of unknown function (DUF4209)
MEQSPLPLPLPLPPPTQYGQHGPTLVLPFVHPTIAAVLLAPSSTDLKNGTGDSFGRRRISFIRNDSGLVASLFRSPRNDDDDDDVVSTDDLVALAMDAQALVYPCSSEEETIDDAVNVFPMAAWCGGDPIMESLKALGKQSNHGGNAAESPTSCLLALLIALNYLESAIRASSSLVGTTTTGGSIVAAAALAGKAPLLKDMLLAMVVVGDSTVVADVCRALLLPTGLNLRNLVWHGFLGDDNHYMNGTTTAVLRPWLSLTLLLVQILGGTGPAAAATASLSSAASVIVAVSAPAHPTSPILHNAGFVSDRCRRQLAHILEQGKTIRTNMIGRIDSSESLDTDDESMEKAAVHNMLTSSDYIPATHESLVRLVRTLLRRNCPALASVVLVVLLEHCLRLQWCRTNNRPDEAVATTGRYYVTLDGHGQRSKHDVILHYDCGTTAATIADEYNNHNHSHNGGYYYSSEEQQQQNQLCYTLGGSTMALLTDLFISGCGGPNLRAALAHGLYDAAFAAELIEPQTPNKKKMMKSSDEGDASSSLFDLADVLLVVFHRAVVVAANTKVEEEGNSSGWTYVPAFSFAAFVADATNEAFAALSTVKQLLLDGAVDTASFLPEIDLACLQIQFDKALKISKYQIGQTSWTIADMYEESLINTNLISLSAARALIVDTLKAVQSFLAKSDPQAMERQRMHMRSFHLFRLSAFALYAALYNIENASDGDGQKVVERTRMVVSTFSTFIFKNDQRSIKAIETFTKAKLVKKSMCDSQTRFSSSVGNIVD